MNSRSTWQVVSLGAIGLALATGGCSETPHVGANPPPASGVASESPAAPDATSAEIELEVVDRAQYDRVIAGLEGQVVLVDFWATWCGPCVRQFPHTVELFEKLRDRGLAVVTVSFDDPDDLDPVGEFLSRHRAGELTNLVNRYGLGSQAMAAFEIVSGALPSYKLYDRTGKLRKTFETDPSANRQFSPQDIEVATEALLAE